MLSQLTLPRINAQENIRMSEAAHARLVREARGVQVAGPLSGLVAVRVHLQGDLADMQSEYEDALAASEVGRRGGPCVASGALQARLHACQAEVIMIQAALDALAG